MVDSGSQLSLNVVLSASAQRLRRGGRERGCSAAARELVGSSRLGGLLGSSAAPPHCCIVLARAAARPRALELETNEEEDRW